MLDVVPLAMISLMKYIAIIDRSYSRRHTDDGGIEYGSPQDGENWNVLMD